MKRLMVLALLICGCSTSAEQAIKRLRLVQVKDSDLCFAITGTASEEGGVAMVQIDCKKIPIELIETVNAKTSVK